MALALKLVAGTAAVAGAGLYLAPHLAHQQPRAAPAHLAARPADPDVLRARLALYDAAPAPALLVPVKSPLQDEVAAARAAAHDALVHASAATTDLRAQVLAWEQHGEHALKSVISDKDQLNPNALYVAVATLAGSIVGRNRILLRLTLPPLFLLGSTAYFLPHSWRLIAPRLRLPDEWSNVRERVDRLIGDK
ncbi:hypothetical protein JCM3770_001952 [Rhodotorula araucariae]